MNLDSYLLFCIYVAFIICGLCWVFVVFLCKLLGKARQASGGFVVARVAEFVQFVVGLGVRVNLECGMNGVVCTDMIMCVVWVMMDKE
jgi:hypothetical protein